MVERSKSVHRQMSLVFFMTHKKLKLFAHFSLCTWRLYARRKQDICIMNNLLFFIYLYAPSRVPSDSWRYSTLGSAKMSPEVAIERDREEIFMYFVMFIVITIIIKTIIF